jgi:hypothetical protein
VRSGWRPWTWLCAAARQSWLLPFLGHHEMCELRVCREAVRAGGGICNRGGEGVRERRQRRRQGANIWREARPHVMWDLMLWHGAMGAGASGRQLICFISLNLFSLDLYFTTKIPFQIFHKKTVSNISQYSFPRNTTESLIHASIV